MEKITKGHPLSQSADIVKENLETLKRLFPTIVKEGKIDVEELKALLDEDIETSEEYYRFTWAGKNEARREANKPSTATLRPCKEESKNWDTTDNIFIEGDNLEVLKLLQKSYAGKIKMMYFDPPYNTGKDFVYKDNYADNLGNYLSITGQTDEEGKRLSTNTESDGRYHSNWLNMMYPRLKLARNLLADDGAIFISINDIEVNNLRKLCDEIFGEENFIAQIVWSNKEGGGSSDSKHFRIKHEYILCFALNKINIEINGMEISNRERYTGSDEFFEKRGPYYLQKLGMGSIQYSESLDYPIQVPDNSFVTPKENNKGKKACWRWSKDKYKWGLENGFVVIKKDSTDIWTVYTKQYLNCDNEGNLIERTQRPFGLIDTFSSTQASKFLDSINLSNYFSYSKPAELIQYLISLTTSQFKNDIVLDIFTGSGTTAHSVIQQNSIDNGNRKFICVQLPEPIDENSEAFKAGYKNIADICKDRIRFTGDKIKTDTADLFSQTENNLDIGFKVFKLDSSNIQAWDGNIENFKQNLFNAQNNIKEKRSEDDVLYEILLKYGLDLTVPIQEKEIAKCKIYAVGGGVLFVCLSDNITTQAAEAIGKWKEELQPATCRALFKDNGFKDDIAKTNSIQILRQYSIEEANSI